MMDGGMDPDDTEGGSSGAPPSAAAGSALAAAGSALAAGAGSLGSTGGPSIAIAPAAAVAGNPLAWLPLAVAVAIPIAFVAALYAVPAAVRALPRDHPVYIAARFRVVGWLALGVPAVVTGVCWVMATQPGATGALAQAALDTVLGAHPYCNTPSSVVRPLAVIVLLFAGPLVQAALLAAAGLPTVFSMFRVFLRGADAGGGNAAAAAASETARLIVWRTAAVAPVSEEWVFRCCLLPLYLLAGTRPLLAVLLTASSFGAAHLHLAGELWRAGYGAGVIALQMGGHLAITTLFGSLAGGMLYASGSFGAVAGAHVFCNVMGPPSVAWWVYPAHPLYPKRMLLAAVYVGGIVASITAASPLLLLRAAPAIHAATFPCALMSAAA